MHRSNLLRSVVATVAASAASLAIAGPVNVFGSADQYAIDTDLDNAAVVAVKNSQPSTGASIGTFGHGRDGFAAVPNLGNLFNGGAGSGQALYIGDSYAATGNRNAFDHSIIKVTFQNPIVNGDGADLAVMLGSGTTPATSRGYYLETLAAGVDQSIGQGNYTNTLWYEQASDFKKNAGNGNGYATFLYDLSVFGIALGNSITELYLSNFDVFSTVSGADGLSGWVNLAGTSGQLIQGGSTYALGGTAPAGANSYYVATPTGANSHFDTDPDLIYAGGLARANAVPEPGSLALAGLVLLGLVGMRRRST